MSKIKINVDNGKYTFAIDQVSHEIVIYRHGEPWHQQEQAFNALYSIMAELDAARVVLDACRKLGESAPFLIQLAMERHRALVSDTQKPSDWAGEVTP